MYKEKNVDILKVARELKVSHVLEGSVRKAGGRIRINAQLVDGETNSHVWADRYDRDSSDIFALQDEISEAIVKALKLRLLPEEKKAIEQRGTSNAEAHNLYLMARQTYITSQEYDPRSAEAIVRLCARATEIDPNYAQAWALMAIGHDKLRQSRGTGAGDSNGMAAAERALAIDPRSAEAHAIKAQILHVRRRSRCRGSRSRHRARAGFRILRGQSLGRPPELSAAPARGCDPPLRKGVAILVEADLNSASMLMSSYTVLGDVEGMRRSAQRVLKRAEAILVHDQNNSMVAGYSAYALAALGEAERAKARMERALLIDPKQLQHALQLRVCNQRLLEGQGSRARHARPGVRDDQRYFPALRQGGPGSRIAAQAIRATWPCSRRQRRDLRRAQDSRRSARLDRLAGGMRITVNPSRP